MATVQHATAPALFVEAADEAVGAPARARGMHAGLVLGVSVAVGTLVAAVEVAVVVVGVRLVM